MEPFLGEIRLMGFAFDTQDGWLLCDGRLLPIGPYQALYALILNRFGGDGISTFALPDLRGRTGLNFSATYGFGAKGGAENIVLTGSTIPTHTHGFIATSENNDKPAIGTSANRLLGTSTVNLYGAAATLVPMNDPVSVAGGAAGHNNTQPSMVVGYCIASQGIWPPRP